MRIVFIQMMPFCIVQSIIQAATQISSCSLSMAGRSQQPPVGGFGHHLEITSISYWTLIGILSLKHIFDEQIRRAMHNATNG